MTTPTTTPNIPVPAGAVDVGPWDEFVPGRNFTGLSWVIEGAGWHPEDIFIEIMGIQRFTGEAHRVIHVGDLHSDNPVTSTQARELGRALIAAADEYDATSVHDSEGTDPA